MFVRCVCANVVRVVSIFDISLVFICISDALKPLRFTCRVFKTNEKMVQAYLQASQTEFESHNLRIQIKLDQIVYGILHHEKSAFLLTNGFRTCPSMSQKTQGALLRSILRSCLVVVSIAAAWYLVASPTQMYFYFFIFLTSFNHTFISHRYT